ncbi:MAG: hypothetical protein HUU28_04120 [Planctomycetaceae bacterium]|nr:hypothetical protein [Planctomycetaceae bacterium]
MNGGLFLGSAALGAAGDIMIFRWAKGGPSGWLPAGVALSALGLMLMGVAFRRSTASFTVCVLLLVAVHVLIDVLWDVGFSGARLSTLEWAGVACAALSVVLLHFGNDRVE